MTDESREDELARSLAHADVPLEAVISYARWWELEIWLRTLAYVELRAKLGRAWIAEVGRTASSRMGSDVPFDYMATSDSSLPLAYADFSVLLDLIDRHQELFAAFLLGDDPRRWVGRAQELNQIRNRIAHCRRPHSDDVARLEQMLRDLEPGARRAVRSYLTPTASPTAQDPVTEGWARLRRKLMRRSTRVRFQLGVSQRPWTLGAPPVQPSSQEGFYWLLTADTFRRRLVAWSAHEQWQSERIPRAVAHIVAPTPASAVFTIPTLEPRDETVLALEWCVETILLATSSDESTPAMGGDEVAHWTHVVDGVDSRVQIRTPLGYHWMFHEDGPPGNLLTGWAVD